jgi:hypothetical protein
MLLKVIKTDKVAPISGMDHAIWDTTSSLLDAAHEMTNDQMLRFGCR